MRLSTDDVTVFRRSIDLEGWQDAAVMEHLRDIAPEDVGAIKVTHRTSGAVVIEQHPRHVRENFREAMRQLCEKINPNPKTISAPTFYPGDQVLLQLPETRIPADVVSIRFDFGSRCWQCELQCGRREANGFYDAAELSLQTE